MPQAFFATGSFLFGMRIIQEFRPTPARAFRRFGAKRTKRISWVPDGPKGPCHLWQPTPEYSCKMDIYIFPNTFPPIRRNDVWSAHEAKTGIT